jgi:hypothetical protein
VAIAFRWFICVGLVIAVIAWPSEPAEVKIGAEVAMVKVWHAHPWVVALDGDTLYRGKFMNSGEEAAGKVRAGASPKDVFGWTGQSLPLANVRSVEWVPAAGTLLVKRHWLRDPWRLTFPGAEKAFRTLADLMPDPTESRSRVGPHDLQMDPRLGIGVFVALIGLIALIGGALEGVGPAPVRGKVFAQIGAEIGPGPALVIGALAFLAGIGGLVWWYVKRPSKVVVRRRGEAAG